MSEEAKQEITNAVLAEKIQGMVKLTDERFSSMKESLNRIEQNNLGFALRTELEEIKKDFNLTIKRMEEAQAKHNDDDKISFGGLSTGQEKLNNTIQRWGGALLLAAFCLPIVVPILLHYVFGW